MNQDINEKEIYYLRKKITDWEKNQNFSFPWRSTKNKWHALVAEIMLQRTRAEQVIPTYKAFVREYTDPKSFLKDNNNPFDSLGLKWRNKELKKLAKILIKKDIPKFKEDLLI